MFRLMYKAAINAKTVTCNDLASYLAEFSKFRPFMQYEDQDLFLQSTPLEHLKSIFVNKR